MKIPNEKARIPGMTRNSDERYPAIKTPEMGFRIFENFILKQTLTLRGYLFSTNLE